MLLMINIKLNTMLNLLKQHQNLKSVIMSGMPTNVTFSLHVALLIGIENYLTLMRF